MKISEAVKQALKQEKMIYRSSIKRHSGNRNTYIKPTNSYDACIIVIYSEGKEIDSCRNWNPTGNDLIADDWELWDELADKVGNT